MANETQQKLSEMLRELSAQQTQIIYELLNSKEPIIGIAIRYENKATTWLARDRNNVDGYNHSPLKPIVDAVIDKINEEISSVEKQADDAAKLEN